MWIKEQNEIMTYSEYMLSEAITPRHIEFGTDCKDGKWKPLGRGFYATHFETREYLYTYLIQNGFVGFFTSDLQHKDEVLAETSIDKILSDRKLFGRKDTSKVIHVFNNFFYITTQLDKTFKLQYLFFDGNDKGLGSLYSSMCKNRFFLKELQSCGWEFKGQQEVNNREFYTFKNTDK